MLCPAVTMQESIKLLSESVGASFRSLHSQSRKSRVSGLQRISTAVRLELGDPWPRSDRTVLARRPWGAARVPSLACCVPLAKKLSGVCEWELVRQETPESCNDRGFEMKGCSWLGHGAAGSVAAFEPQLGCACRPSKFWRGRGLGASLSHYKCTGDSLFCESKASCCNE